MRTFVIYRIWNIISGKSYIGQTCNLFDRLRRHFNADGRCPALHDSIKKYGRDAFDWEVVVEDLSEAEVDDAEREMIKKFNCISPYGYNLNDGGSNTKNILPQTRQKISESLKGQYVGEKHPMYGKNHTTETREKLSQINTGKKVPIEVRRQISETLMGHPVSDETRVKMSVNRKKKNAERRQKQQIESGQLFFEWEE